MRTYTHYIYTIIIVLAISLFWAVPVLADEDSPEIEPTSSEETAEGIEQAETEDEAPLPDLLPVDSESETEDSSLEDLVAQVPANTEIVVLDEEGQAIPLATEEAAEAIVIGDPIWCPASVAVPNPGLSGCTASYNSLAALLNELQTAGGLVTDPSVDGVIWIESTYLATNDNANVIFNGSNFTNMDTFKLTFKGGWAGCIPTCVSTLDPNAPSEFDVAIQVVGWANDVTVMNINVENASGDGIYIYTSGNITVTNVESNNNTGRGAYLNNTIDASGTKNVNITDSVFNNNTQAGLDLVSNGVVTIKNLTANGNASAGATIDNDSAPSPKAVTLSGDNTFNGNASRGLTIYSRGVITVNNITANNNTNGGGAYLDNNGNVADTSGIKVTGLNIFDNNSGSGSGLQIYSNGAVTISNVIATSNNANGLNIDNSSAITAQPVSLTGTNILKLNTSTGLYILSEGQITINNVNASQNTGYGANLQNQVGSTASVTITGTNQFSQNTGGFGLSILSSGVISLNNITASNNSLDGAQIWNYQLGQIKNVTMTGTNVFNNNGQYGLDIISNGSITLNSITADNNTITGAFVDTLTNGKTVTLTGTNSFSNNQEVGLNINILGAITVNNLTVNNNGNTAGEYGANLVNSSASTAAGITINGTNSFSNNYAYGLLVQSNGVIKGNNITASNNIGTVSSYGAIFNNNQAGSVNSGVTLTGTNVFSGNSAQNLTIESKGAVSVSNVTANSSANAGGVRIVNTYASTAQLVTMTGNNFANNNIGDLGVGIYSKGAITISNLTANGNGDSGSESGADLDNSTSTVKSPVTINGTNVFNNNYYTGIYVESNGVIKANNITANNNVTYAGAFLNNNEAVATVASGVTLTGTNLFDGNNVTNLYITTKGAITLNNVIASNSINGYGASLSNTPSSEATPKPVTITGTNSFSGNDEHGLFIYTYGAVTLNNITATGNGTGGFGDGVYIDNKDSTLPIPILSLVKLTGTNNLSNNVNGIGLNIQSLGAITINNITATNNAYGAYLDNDALGALGNVTITGYGVFTDNTFYGINIYSSGNVALSNLNSSNNVGSEGLTINNSFNPASPKSVSLSGTNTFNNNGGWGLQIFSYGTVTINNLNANNNGSVGADIYNDLGTLATNVTLTGTSTLNGNNGTNLNVDTKGTIKINTLTANNSATGHGASLDSEKDVILTGTNTFISNGSGNDDVGLSIISLGAITISNLTANENDNGGVNLNNFGASTPKPITLTGNNTFLSNDLTGLYILSKGAVTTNNITASGNGAGMLNGTGVEIQNDGGTANVTMNGKNIFNDNYFGGLEIYSAGSITLSNVTAKNNNTAGVYLDNSAGAPTTKITLTGTNTFVNNAFDGLRISSNGAVILSKVTSEDNGDDGIHVVANGNVTLTCGWFTNNTMYGVHIDVPAPSIIKLVGVVSVGNTNNDFQFPDTGTVTETRACP